LEDLRLELRTRSQELNKELIDLVNDNYQDFLGLGDSLKGGEEKVEEIRLGLLAFRREVDGLKKKVAGRHTEVASLIQERRGIAKEERLGRNLLEIDSRLMELEEGLDLANGKRLDAESLSLDFLDSDSDSDEDSAVPLARLERRAQQYVQLRRLINKIGPSHPYILKQDTRLSKIRQILLLDLNSALQTLKEDRKSGQDKILKLLNMYQSLDESAEALKIIKTNAK
jgi:conserved oligomeric Golgi complex subunit 2